MLHSAIADMSYNGFIAFFGKHRKIARRRPEKTLEFGKAYAKNLKAGEIVVLNGEMGAGKTVFVKGVALG